MGLFWLQGLVYQLVDDALDFTGSKTTLGKPALSDLREVPFLAKRTVQNYNMDMKTLVASLYISFYTLRCILLMD